MKTLTLIATATTAMLMAASLAASASASPAPENPRVQPQVDSLSLNVMTPESPHAPVPANDESYQIERDNAWQVDKNAVLADLRKQYPNDYAGSWRQDRAVTVAFSGLAPEGAVAFLEASPFDFTYQENVGVSEKDLAALTQELHDDAVGIAGSGVTVTTVPSLEQRSIEVLLGGEVADSSTGTGSNAGTANAASATAEVSADEVRDKLIESVGEKRLGVLDLKVEVSPLAGIKDAGWGEAGGERLTALNGSLVCTSAFVVSSRVNADIGVLTAGHCEGTLLQNNRYIFDFRAEHQGNYGDIEVRRSPRMMDAWFHYDYGRGWPVRGKDIASSGDSVCRFGHTTGRECGTVRETGVTATPASGITSRNLTAYSGVLGDLGDSGGPVYSSYTAYGMTKGFMPDKRWNLYSPIEPALQLFKLDLCTDPVGCR